MFLRYLALLGQVPAGLASQVSRPRMYRLAGLPRALEETDLRRVLRSVRHRDPGGRRDYAILMVFATYGLRVSDVAALRLDDIHWGDGAIAIQVEKTGRPLVLPLTDPVGDALADYLQHARPRCDRREVFLSLRKPPRPLTKGQISTLVGEAMERAGVKLHASKKVADLALVDLDVAAVLAFLRKRVHPHSLRHTTAVHMRRAGDDSNAIAALLGHAQITTTERFYGHVDLEEKRKAIEANPPPVKKARGQWRRPEVLEFLAGL